MSTSANNIRSILREAAIKTIASYPTLKSKINPDDIESLLSSTSLPLGVLLAEAAVIATRASVKTGSRSRRQSLKFVTAKRSSTELAYTEKSAINWSLDVETVRDCMVASNTAIELIHDMSLMYGIGLFESLGMRNLSSFIGELFVKEMQLAHTDYLMRNPNQDGYPDLCALTPEAQVCIKGLRDAKGLLKLDKIHWSPFPYGGLEVKATCGNTPPASKQAKPLIGDSRLPTMVSAEWKAHHQLTQKLLGILWDFLDGLPTILATFYRNDLDTRSGAENRDWGAIIHPKEGGGRTTSVSIMKRGRSSEEGVRKMGAGWLVLPSDPHLRQPIEKIFGIET